MFGRDKEQNYDFLIMTYKALWKQIFIKFGLQHMLTYVPCVYFERNITSYFMETLNILIFDILAVIRNFDYAKII